jgi:hypothetical protein
MYSIAWLARPVAALAGSPLHGGPDWAEHWLEPAQMAEQAGPGSEALQQHA